MRHGELYWAKPDPSVGSEQAGRRPVLMVSSDDAIAAIPNVVTTIPVTTRDRGWATHVRISGATTGLTQPSWALCEQVRTISTQRIAARLGVVDADTLAGVTRVLRYLLNL
ncbi:MAG: type II toxin-antitoxin system PemK/MazF family toxin [Nocardioidaceae bacterium]